MCRVRVAFRYRYVPYYLSLEVRVVFDLVPCLGKEDLEFDTFIIIQHSEQRGVVLDGVSAEDGKPMHQRQDWKVFTSFLAAEFALCLVKGSRLGDHSSLHVSNLRMLD